MKVNARYRNFDDVETWLSFPVSNEPLDVMFIEEVLGGVMDSPSHPFRRDLEDSENE